MIADRTTKMLLTAIALLLAGILIRPMLAPTPAQAQAQVFPPYVPHQIVVDKGTVYVLTKNALSVYRVRDDGKINSEPQTKVDEIARTYVGE